MGMIIPKQTAAKTESRSFTSGSVPKTKTIAINEVDEDGATRALYDDDGVPVVLTATSGPLMVDSPINLHFVKTVTANAVGVMLVE